MKKILKKTNLFAVSLAIIITLTCFGGEDSGLWAHAAAVNDTKILVGGVPFGVKFFSHGIVIVGFTEIETENGVESPAYDAGLRINDIITRVNGQNVHTSSEMIERVENSDNMIEITFIRNGNEDTVRFTPALCSTDGKRKTGMWIRDTTAGIGTVTFVDANTGAFAGLGHGICDAETGELLKMERGTVMKVQISGIKKGAVGTPGELQGYFTSEKTGTLLKNTECGVYGILAEIPAGCGMEETTLGKRRDVMKGKAHIWCTLGDGEPQKYEITIDEIRINSRDNRSFSITVTDKQLLEKTGGIVQGMSGSPIIQDGKLVGAVTHVLINDPTKGYGIFIENMLDAAG